MPSSSGRLGIKDTQRIAAYLQTRFRDTLLGSTSETYVPTAWNLQFLQECNLAVDVVVQAFNNQKKVNWSVEEYVAHISDVRPRASGQNDDFESSVRQLFAPIKTGRPEFQVKPFVLVDKSGKILLWYLPGILKDFRQKQMWEDIQIIEKTLEVQNSSSSWRINPDHYLDRTRTRFKPGTLSLSPAWFQQAHASKLEVSANLRKQTGLEWVKKNRKPSAFIGAILAILHQDLFKAGVSAIKKINNSKDIDKAEELPKILESWTSPFSGLSIINNRNTPPHRDNGSAYPWFDILASVGPYTRGIMTLPGIGLELMYSPGTLVALAGRVVVHSAQAEGERTCFAYYMKKNVFESLGIAEPGWADIADITNL